MRVGDGMTRGLETVTAEESAGVLSKLVFAEPYVG